jgi:NADH:ubiquinone oxidoreductase subunit H
VSEWTDALGRAAGTLLWVALALPVVAALERFRGERTSTTTVGPRGARTALATAIKLIQKRAPRADRTDRLLSNVAPVLLLVPTVGALAILPLAPDDAPGSSVPLLLSLSLLATGAVALAGYAAQNPLALLSALRLVALRATALVVVGVSALAPLRSAGTVDLAELVRAQSEPLFAWIPRWGALTAPASFAAALIAFALLVQQAQRTRSDATLIEPWFGEATGPVQLGHRLFESADLLANAGVIAVVFLGGWHLPGVDGTAPWAASAGVVMFKLFVALILILLVRRLLPMMSIPSAVRMAWTVLFPLAVAGAAFTELFR